jgi:opacity protein-like surface antigen
MLNCLSRWEASRSGPPETERLMLKRLWVHGVHGAIGLMAAAAILSPAPAFAQITRVSSTDHRQSVGFTLGGFFPKGEDGRVAGDVIVRDLDDLVFDINDLRGPSLSGEWLFSLGNYLEAGVGVGFHQGKTTSVYRAFQNATGSEIEQELKLRVVPVTGSVRFLPAGHGSVEPYVGIGVGVFNWRWSETGEFVDTSDGSIFRANYIAKGTSVGPVILAGVRFPFADVWDVGGELQWQKATGDIDQAETGLLGDKIDLGGWHALATMHIRF